MLTNYLTVGAILFALGTVGFLTRRNLIVMFLCAEMMLQGIGLNLVAFGTAWHNWHGQVFVIYVLTVAAAEAAIALALVVMLFQRRGSLDVTLWQALREPDQPPIEDEPEPPESVPGAEPVWPRLPAAGIEPERTNEEQTIGTTNV